MITIRLHRPGHDEVLASAVHHGHVLNIRTLSSACGKVQSISTRACWARDLKLPLGGFERGAGL